MEQFITEFDAYIRWYNGIRISTSPGGKCLFGYGQDLGNGARKLSKKSASHFWGL